jgi:hypothetical protein
LPPQPEGNRRRTAAKSATSGSRSSSAAGETTSRSLTGDARRLPGDPAHAEFVARRADVECEALITSAQGTQLPAGGLAILAATTGHGKTTLVVELVLQFKWLRRTAVALMRQAGLEPEVIAKRLGHADTGELVLTVYCEVDEEIELLDALKGLGDSLGEAIAKRRSAAK